MKKKFTLVVILNILLFVFCNCDVRDTDQDQDLSTLIPLALLGLDNQQSSGDSSESGSDSSANGSNSSASGSGSSESGGSDTTETTYTVGGSISGLSASGLVLQNNSADDLSISSDGTFFAFATGITSGGAYAVSVKTQPNSQVCTVSNGSGTVSDNVTDVSVTCQDAYTVSGSISGLSASGLVLQNNSGDDLSISSGATSFTFATAITNGGAYAVSVKTQPNSQVCTVSSGSGTVSADVTGVSVSCQNAYTVGGSISGLSASGLVLQNNSGDDLSISSSATSFTFVTAITNGGAYAVSVKTQPNSQVCTVSSGSGTVSADVTGVSVSCQNAYTVGGSISGLSASGLVLQNNSGDDLSISSSATSFAFATAITNGGAYDVSVKNQPNSLFCTVSSGSGTVSADVTGVSVSCQTTYTVSGSISGLSASGLVLQNNVGDDLSISSGATSFAFATAITSGGAYAVSVKNQPNSQFCTVSNGSGTASANITDVSVSCQDAYTVSGTIKFLIPGHDLVIQNNSGDDFTISGSGIPTPTPFANNLTSFTFPTTVGNGGTYSISVKGSNRYFLGGGCTISNGSGTVNNANVTDVYIDCTNACNVSDCANLCAITGC
ncbi:MAG: hypothetical protein AAF518_19025 [Spirochaetota bacterium]